MFAEVWFWVAVALTTGGFLVMGTICSKIEKQRKLKKEAEEESSLSNLKN